MYTKSIKLSSEGIKNQNNFPDSDECFTFFINEKASFQMKINKAEFISPIVSSRRKSDKQVKDMRFDYNSNDIEEYFTNDIITILYKLSNGDKVDINQLQCFKMLIIAMFLGNLELYNQVSDAFDTKINEKNVDYYMKHLRLFHHFSKSPQQYCQYDHIIDFIASQFYNIERSYLLFLPKQIIYSIISNPNLKLENEDSLFQFIKLIFFNSTKESDELCINDFLKHINFLKLSEGKLTEALECIERDKVSHDLWMTITSCFKFYKKSSEDEKTSRYLRTKQSILFDGNHANALNGIICYLTKSAGKNVHDNGTINVSSSTIHNNWHGKLACDFGALNYFHSDNIPNSWLCYDFKEKKVHPTHYSIRSRHDYGSNGTNPKNWVVEGSNTADDNDWKILDERKEIVSFNNVNFMQTFDIQKEIDPNESYRYLRIRQNGLSNDGRNYFVISALEYFGDLFCI